MSNITKNRSADLVYSFPIEAPMRVLFVDIYAAGAEFNFLVTKHYLIAACGMASFAIAEDTAEQNSTVFVAVLTLHVLSGENHDPMIVERISRYLNSVLTIFYNEIGNNRVALEGVLMSLYG